MDLLFIETFLSVFYSPKSETPPFVNAIVFRHHDPLGRTATTHETRSIYQL